MSQRRRVIERITRMLEAQGAVVTSERSGGVRIRCPEGQIISIHGSPKNNGDQVKMIRRDVLRTGLEWNLPPKL